MPKQIPSNEEERRRFEALTVQEGFDPIDYAREEDQLREKHPNELSAIHTSRVVEQQIMETVRVKEQLGTDELTGALNLRRYKEKVARLQVQAEKNHHGRRTDPEIVIEEPFSIVTIDVDHFKKINDRYGHRAGDMVLKELVRRISSRLRVRSGDFLARVGGEEFRIVALAINGKAPQLAEILRQIIADTPFDVMDNSDVQHKINVTASFGVSPYDRKTENMESHSDEALYAAKGKDQSAGARNEVWVWDTKQNMVVPYHPNGENALAA